MLRELQTGLLLWLCLAASAALYWPGLAGGFLLDDAVNLGLVEKLSPLPSLSELALCSFSGMAGGLGRPIAQLSFCLQADAWPGYPEVFKYFNLMLHLLNGCLVFWTALLLCRLGRGAWLLEDARPHHGYFHLVLPLGVSAFWMWNPLFVSTVLYSVQRMTELSALFSLMAILFYLVGRQWGVAGRWRAGYCLMACGLAIFGGAAVLSKENALLLPWLILVLEGTLLAHLATPPGWRIWRILALWGPAFFLVGFIAWHFDGLVLATYRLRDFSISERLLTEVAALWSYVAKLLWPMGHSYGLFYDDFPLVGVKGLNSWLGLKVFGLVSIAVLAIYWRRQFPLASFSVGWFLIGHGLESSIIPLEIYYEHRNYLPAVSLCFGLLYGLMRIPSIVKGGAIVPRVVGYGAVGLLLVLAAISTWQQTRLWGRPVAQSAIWASEHPLSKRAQGWAGVQWAAVGEMERSEAAFRNLVALAPQSADGNLYLLFLACQDSEVRPPAVSDMIDQLGRAPLSNGAISIIGDLVEREAGGECSQLSGGVLEGFIQALLKNPQYRSRRANLFHILGKFHLAHQRYLPAQMAWDSAFAERPDVGLALFQARVAAEFGVWDAAQLYAGKAREICESHRNLVRRELCLHEVSLANGTK